MRAFPNSWKFSSFHMLTLPFNHLTIFLVRRTPACSEIRNFFDMHLLSSTIYPFKRASRSLLKQVYVGTSWELLEVMLAQVGLKLAHMGPLGGHLGSSSLNMPHLGPNLAQIDLKLASSWPQDEPMERKSRKLKSIRNTIGF